MNIHRKEPGSDEIVSQNGFMLGGFIVFSGSVSLIAFGRTEANNSQGENCVTNCGDTGNSNSVTGCRRGVNIYSCCGA